MAPSPSQQHQEGQRTTLESLADEILVAIAEHVGGQFRAPVYPQSDALHPPKSLHSLALCSRRFHQATEPVLYSYFRPHVNSGTTAQTTQLFMCRILARPDLANRVRVFHDFVRTPHQFPMDVSRIKNEDWMRVRGAVRAASQSEGEAMDWTEDIKNGSWDAIVALVLTIMPNLQALEFDGCGSNAYLPRMHILLQRAAGLLDHSQLPAFALKNLSRVSLEYGASRHGMQTETLFPFLRLKSLHSLSAVFVVENARYDELNFEEESFDGPYTWRSTWLDSRVKHEFGTKDISLYRSNIDHHTLNKFLHCFPSLERFHYEHGGQLVGYSRFEPPRLIEAWEHLKSCLRELSIINNDIGSSEYGLYPIGCLAGFQKLASVDMTASLLIGEDCDEPEYPTEFRPKQSLVEALPASIISLSIRGCQENIVAPIFELLSNLEDFPTLKRLDLQWETIKYPDKPSPLGPIVHPGFTKEEVERLLEKCEAAGIEVMIKAVPLNPP